MKVNRIISLIGLLLIILPSLIINTSCLGNAYEINKRHIVKDTDLLKGQLDLVIDNIINLTKLSAERSDVIDDLKKDSNTRLQKAVEQIYELSTYYDDVLIANKDGYITAHTDKRMIGLNIKDLPVWEGLKDNELYIDPYPYPSDDGDVIFYTASPVYGDEDGEDVFIGVFAVVVNLTSISQRYMEKHRFGITGHTVIFDDRGIILAHPNPDMILNNDKMTEHLSIAYKSGVNTGFITYTYNENKSYVAYHKLDKLNWYLGITIDASEMNKKPF